MKSDEGNSDPSPESSFISISPLSSWNGDGRKKNIETSHTWIRKQSRYLTIFLCFPARERFSTSCKTFLRSSLGVIRICLSAKSLWSNLFSSLNTRPKFPWPTILRMLNVLLRLLRPIGAFLLGDVIFGDLLGLKDIDLSLDDSVEDDHEDDFVFWLTVPEWLCERSSRRLRQILWVNNLNSLTHMGRRKVSVWTYFLNILSKTSSNIFRSWTAVSTKRCCRNIFS